MCKKDKSYKKCIYKLIFQEVLFINYCIFDAHCDTALKIHYDKKSLYDSDCEVSVKKLENYKSATFTMAVFNDGSLKMEDIFLIFDNLDAQRKQINNPNVNFIYAIEGLGNTADFEINHLDKLKSIGVKFISLTHNNDNFLCGGIGENKKGLTSLGEKTLDKMSEFDFILDLSHISDKGFYEAVGLYDKRICATHSNSRSVCANARNLTDDMFLQIKNKNGVCGINLYPVFLSDTYLTKNASSYDAIKHIEHFLSLGGEDNIGIGADFDGIDLTPSDIKDCSQLYILFDNMLKLNYKEDIINKISHLNYEKLLKFQ